MLVTVQVPRKVVSVVVHGVALLQIDLNFMAATNKFQGEVEMPYQLTDSKPSPAKNKPWYQKFDRKKNEYRKGRA